MLLPLSLLVGFLTRQIALLLFGFNIVAVISCLGGFYDQPGQRVESGALVDQQQDDGVHTCLYEQGRLMAFFVMMAAISTTPLPIMERQNDDSSGEHERHF